MGSIEDLGYDPAELAAEAEVRLEEKNRTYRLLAASSSILELVVQQIAGQVEKMRRGEIGITDPIPPLVLDTKHILDILGTHNMTAAADTSHDAQQATQTAAQSELGRANAVKDSLDFLYRQLGNNATAEAFGTGVEDGGLAGG